MPKLKTLGIPPTTFWLKSLILGVISTISNPNSICAAEKIYLIYGPMNLSVKVESLATFAEKGAVNRELKFYLDRFSPAQQNQLRGLLQRKTKIDPVLFSRLLNSQFGERILTQLGGIINIQGGRNGSYALRGAMVQTALDNKELNLIRILQNLSTDIQIRIDQVFDLLDVINKTIEQNKLVTQEMARLSTLAADQDNSVNFHQLPELTEQGEFRFTEENITLKDQKRQREFYVHFYKPEISQRQKIPVIIISHGLAARPENFSKYARHLASYGYLVALPQHPGSDFKQIKDLINGASREVFSLQEFVDRPLDISYLLDELERRNISDFNGKLDLNNVGVFGQSFGGYTALALGGAEIDFENLERDCQGQISYVNLSLVVQCSALDLPKKNYSLKDDRVKAIIASNPLNGSIFGDRGLSKIQIPVLLVAGSHDPATPIIFEQIKSFYSFNTPEKYISIIEGQAHLDFGELDENLRQKLTKIAKVELAKPESIDTYNNAIILAFFEVYISQKKSFLNYLKPSYSAYLSQNQPFKFYLLNKPLVNQLTPIIDRFNLKN
jgi:predicted dienelactone hydrolase